MVTFFESRERELRKILDQNALLPIAVTCRVMSGDISPHDEVCQARKQIAGDVRHGSIKRVASAGGEGSIATKLVHQYLDRF
jgi:hypothetical protein